jgi:hypothetical protein
MLPVITFFIAFISTLLIPGINLLTPLRRSLLEKIVLGTAVGIVLWVIQAYTFGLMGARWLTYVYIIANAIIFVFLFKRNLNPSKKDGRAIDKLSLIIIIVGTILNLSAVWFIGVKTSEGLFFCCRGVPDAIYHLSLTNELIKHFPPNEPGMYGINVKNYHYLSNLLSADISRVWKLDFIKVQFQYMSLITALLLGGSGLVLGQILSFNRVIIRWLLIFLYGSGDIIYFLIFLRGYGLNFNVTVMDDASKLLAGPPRALSIALLLSGICLLAIFFKRKSLYAGLISAVMMGVLVGFKVYTGIFAISGFAVIGCYLLLKREFKMLIVPLLALFVALTYYIPNNKGAGGLVFNGLWRFENFMENKDLTLSKLDYLRASYASRGNIPAVAALEVLFIIIYFITLFGTVTLGFFQSKNSLKLIPKEINLFLIGAIIVSLIAGSFFYQETGGANTVQFLITVFIVGAIYASVALYYWTRKLPKYLRYLIFVLVFVLTVARPVYEVSDNFKSIINHKGILVTNGQLEAFNFIKASAEDNSVVAVEPWMAEDEPFMYATFLIDKPLYLSGAGVLRDHGQVTSHREKILQEIFPSKDKFNEERVLNILNREGISYIYVPRGVDFYIENSSKLKKVFGNSDARVFYVI